MGPYGYYDPDVSFFLGMNVLNGAVGWSILIYAVLVYLSLTIWKDQINRLDRMGVAARLLGLAFVLPVVTALLAFLVTVITFNLAGGRDGDVLGVIVGLIGGGGSALALLASGIFFLVAILPGKESDGALRAFLQPPVPPLKREASVPAQPVKEPWED